MIEWSRGLFRKTLFRTIRFLKHPRKLKRSALHGYLARHSLDKQVWRPTQHSLAGGAALGTFITLQLLPVQMPSAVLLGAVLRLNIPIALVLCWVSNPFTLAALVPLEYAVGKWALSLLTTVPTTPFPARLPHDAVELWMALREHAPVMLFGGVVLGALLAPLIYMAFFFGWGFVVRRSQARRQLTLPLEGAPPSDEAPSAASRRGGAA